MSALLSQFGIKTETTYGTAVAVDRFFEFNETDIAGVYERIEAEGIRSGTRVLREDRWAVNPKGAEGSVTMEVLSKGFGLWLSHMLGAIATGAAADSVTTHTATVGQLDGKSFTAQIGRPDIGNTVRPYTYAGGKVASWELSNSVDGILTLEASCDFTSETIPVASPTGAFALQAVSYPASTPIRNEILTFVGANMTIGGTEVPVTEFSLSGDNGLKTDRYLIRTTGGKKEQVEESMRSYEWSATAEFEDLTQISRVASATATGAVAALVARWVSPSLVGTTTPASLTVTIPVARFDEPSAAAINGPSHLELPLSGKALTPIAGTSPVTIAYATADTTP